MQVFDIETGPLPDKVIWDRVPTFDPKSVKLGRMNDPAKIAATVKKVKDEYERKALEKAALDPSLGRVLAIGLLESQSGEVIKGSQAAKFVQAFMSEVEQDHQERELLKWFFGVVDECSGKFVGHNIKGFDLPFLVGRARLLGWRDIMPPALQSLGQGRYWPPYFVDTMEVWFCGERNKYIGLTLLCKILGVRGKWDGLTGADFAKVLKSGNFERAARYLKDDVLAAWRAAERMGIE